jgi:hypothetical protein
MSRTRLEISIAYTDRKGQKRYANKLGNLWLDTETMKGSIDLPPGVSIHAVEGAYINVQPPFEKEGGEHRGSGQHRDSGVGSQYQHDDSDSVPF